MPGESHLRLMAVDPAIDNSALPPLPPPLSFLASSSFSSSDSDYSLHRADLSPFSQASTTDNAPDSACYLGDDDSMERVSESSPSSASSSFSLPSNSGNSGSASSDSLSKAKKEFDFDESIFITSESPSPTEHHITIDNQIITQYHDPYTGRRVNVTSAPLFPIPSQLPRLRFLSSSPRHTLLPNNTSSQSPILTSTAGKHSISPTSSSHTRANLNNNSSNNNLLVSTVSTATASRSIRKQGRVFQVNNLLFTSCVLHAMAVVYLWRRVFQKFVSLAALLLVLSFLFFFAHTLFHRHSLAVHLPLSAFPFLSSLFSSTGYGVADAPADDFITLLSSPALTRLLVANNLHLPLANDSNPNCTACSPLPCNHFDYYDSLLKYELLTIRVETTQQLDPITFKDLFTREELDQLTSSISLIPYTSFASSQFDAYVHLFHQVCLQQRADPMALYEYELGKAESNAKIGIMTQLPERPPEQSVKEYKKGNKNVLLKGSSSTVGLIPVLPPLHSERLDLQYVEGVSPDWMYLQGTVYHLALEDSSNPIDQMRQIVTSIKVLFPGSEELRRPNYVVINPGCMNMRKKRKDKTKFIPLPVSALPFNPHSELILASMLYQDFTAILVQACEEESYLCYENIIVKESLVKKKAIEDESSDQLPATGGSVEDLILLRDNILGLTILDSTVARFNRQKQRSFTEFVAQFFQSRTEDLAIGSKGGAEPATEKSATAESDTRFTSETRGNHQSDLNETDLNIFNELVSNSPLSLRLTLLSHIHSTHHRIINSDSLLRVLPNFYGDKDLIVRPIKVFDSLPITSQLALYAHTDLLIVPYDPDLIYSYTMPLEAVVILVIPSTTTLPLPLSVHTEVTYLNNVFSSSTRNPERSGWLDEFSQAYSRRWIIHRGELDIDVNNEEKTKLMDMKLNVPILCEQLREIDIWCQ